MVLKTGQLRMSECTYESSIYYISVPRRIYELLLPIKCVMYLKVLKRSIMWVVLVVALLLVVFILFVVIVVIVVILLLLILLVFFVFLVLFILF